MNPLPVSARWLHRRRIRLRDGSLKRASLFPFFDGLGDVQALMLVAPPAPEIFVLEKVDRVRTRFWAGVELDLELAELRDAGDRVGPLARLWHFDPWWVLREACFEGHPAVPILKATNCADAFSKRVTDCYFNRDLSRLTGVMARGSNRSFLSALDQNLVEFTPDLLPERPAAVPPATPPSKDWILDPFWLRRSWRHPASGPPMG